MLYTLNTNSSMSGCPRNNSKYIIRPYDMFAYSLSQEYPWFILLVVFYTATSRRIRLLAIHLWLKYCELWCTPKDTQTSSRAHTQHLSFPSDASCTTDSLICMPKITGMLDQNILMNVLGVCCWHLKACNEDNFEHISEWWENLTLFMLI